MYICINRMELRKMENRIDKEFCMSSFLTIRYVYNEVAWKENIIPINNVVIDSSPKIKCRTADDIDRALRTMFDHMDLSHAALLLSGGIDSGILASYMPKGTKAYTAHHQSPLTELEVERAAKICEINQLEHHVIEITWDDYDKKMDDMMLKANCPVTANEPQVHKLVEQAIKDGADLIIFGDAADMVFGGYDQKLAKDWTFDEWVEEYTFVDPKTVLKAPADMGILFDQYKIGENGVDYLRFMNDIFSISSGISYYNSFEYFGVNYLDPYVRLVMSEPLDLKRVRNGESKYLLRELYQMKYPGVTIPEKVAMPRSMNVWLDWWEGPERPEFVPGCTETLTYEQKFLVYSLERYLNIIEG